MLPHELYVAIQAFLARLRAKMHVTLRGLARALQVASRHDPRGALLLLTIPAGAELKQVALLRVVRLECLHVLRSRTRAQVPDEHRLLRIDTLALTRPARSAGKTSETHETRRIPAFWELSTRE